MVRRCRKLISGRHQQVITILLCIRFGHINSPVYNTYVFMSSRGFYSAIYITWHQHMERSKTNTTFSYSLLYCDSQRCLNFAHNLKLLCSVVCFALLTIISFQTNESATELQGKFFNLKAKPKQFIAFIWSDAKKVIVKYMESLYHVYGSKL